MRIRPPLGLPSSTAPSCQSPVMLIGNNNLQFPASSLTLSNAFSTESSLPKNTNLTWVQPAETLQRLSITPGSVPRTCLPQSACCSSSFTLRYSDFGPIALASLGFFHTCKCNVLPLISGIPVFLRTTFQLNFI